MKCFADDGNTCRALNIKECRGCKFYKSVGEFNRSRLKALKRAKAKGLINREGEYIGGR